MCVLGPNKTTAETINIDTLVVILYYKQTANIFGCKFCEKVKYIQIGGKNNNFTFMLRCRGLLTRVSHFFLIIFSQRTSIVYEDSYILIYHSVTTRALQHYPETGKVIIFFTRPPPFQVQKKPFVRFNIIRYNIV